jgi:hypothetical protein
MLPTRRRGSGRPDSVVEIAPFGADGNAMPSVRGRTPVVDEPY